MLLQQQQLPYRPITIKLESRCEAEALFDLIDKIESFRCNADHGLTPDCFTSKEVELVIKLSNARTNQDIVI